MCRDACTEVSYVLLQAKAKTVGRCRSSNNYCESVVTINCTVHVSLINHACTSTSNTPDNHYFSCSIAVLHRFHFCCCQEQYLKLL